MEKINLSLLFIAILAISLGCGSNDDDGNDDTPSDTGSGGGGSDTGTGPSVCDTSADGGVPDGGCPTDNDTGSGTGIDENAIDNSLCATSGPVGETELIAGFENGNSLADCEGCMGVYTYDDGTGVLDPDASYGAQAPVKPMTKACSPNVFCVSGTTGFSHWGTGWRVDFVHAPDQDPARLPRDLSAYRGIGVWVMVAEGATGIKISFPDPNTDVAGGQCYDATNLEPSWEHQINRPREEKLDDCENDWGQTFSFPEHNKWYYVEALFDNAAISPFWGRQVQDQGLLRDQIYGVKFGRDATATPYTVCIDDLVLLK